jgi:hypothetical protein
MKKAFTFLMFHSFFERKLKNKGPLKGLYFIVMLVIHKHKYSY